MIPVYDNNARRRIANSVRYTEAMARDQPRDQFRRGSSPAGVMAIAAADIEHDQIGECLRAEADTFSAAASPISGDSFQVWNPLSRIWNGSRVWIEPVAMTDAGLSWAIVNAWSSTLARGTAGATIATNSSGNLTSVSHADGHGPTTISAFNPGAEVASGAKVWAALVWTGTASRWEIITPAAGESSGPSSVIPQLFSILGGALINSIPSGGQNSPGLSLAGGVTSNHGIDLTAGAQTFTGESVRHVYGSLTLNALGTTTGQGPVRLELQTSPDGSSWSPFATVMVPYLRSTLAATSSVGFLSTLTPAIQWRVRFINDSAETARFTTSIHGFTISGA